MVRRVWIYRPHPVVRAYLFALAEHLDLKVHDKPELEFAECNGIGEHEGFDAFLPMEGSGISLYVWTSARFFAVVLFSCNTIDVEQAERFTRDFFVANSLQALPF